MSARWTPHTPGGWEAHCRQNRLLFLSAAWGDALWAGFRSQPLYAVDEHGAKGTLLRVFPAGPFRIGYLGFPIAVAAGTQSWAQWVEQIRSGTYESRVDQVRMVCSAFSEQPKGLASGPATVETRIPSLPDWSLDSVKSSVRYEIRKAAKRGITIDWLTDPRDMRSAYEFYAQTLQRYGGTKRYTPAYFDALGHLSLRSDLVRISLPIMKTGWSPFWLPPSMVNLRTISTVVSTNNTVGIMQPILCSPTQPPGPSSSGVKPSTC